MARQMECGGHGYVVGHLCGAKLKFSGEETGAN